MPHLGCCIVQCGHQLTGHNCVLLLHHNPKYRAFTGGSDVNGDLVCLHLRNGLILCHCITRLFQDGGDGACVVWWGC